MEKQSKISLFEVSVLLMTLVMIAFYNVTPVVILLQLVSFGCAIVDCSGIIEFEALTKKYIIWWVLFIAFFAASYFWEVNKSTYVSMMISIIQVAVVGFTILQYATSKEKTNRLLNTAIVACVILTARFIIQVPFSALSSGRIGKYIGEAYGNDGAAMILCYGSLLALIQSRKTQRKLALLILPFMLLALLTGTKLCILTFLVGILCLYIFSSNATGSKIWVVFLILIVGYILFRILMEVPVFYETIGFRLESLFDVLSSGVKTNKSYYDSSEVRYLLIKYGFELFKESPILGNGLDSYRFLTPLSGYYAHNNFIELIVDGGITGLVMYYWFPVFCVILIVKKLRTNKQLAYPLAIMIAILVSDIATISFNHEKTQLVFALSLCMINTFEENKVNLPCQFSYSKYIRISPPV